MTRWRGIRRRGAFPSPQSDLPAWEVDLIDSLRSLAEVKVERYAFPAVLAVARGTLLPALESGWCLRVDPREIVADIPLPPLDASRSGDTIALVNTCSPERARAVRLDYGGRHIAGAVGANSAATCIWTGQTWEAITGRVEWTHCAPNPLWLIATMDTPSVAPSTGTLGVWGHAAYYPANRNSAVTWGADMPLAWIGSGIRSRFTIMQDDTNTGTFVTDLQIGHYDIDGTPFPIAGGSSPLYVTGTVTTTMLGVAGRCYTCPCAGPPDPALSLASLRGGVVIRSTRNNAASTYKSAVWIVGESIVAQTVSEGAVWLSSTSR